MVRWPEYLAMARAAEEVGFDSIWLGDHLLYRDDGAAGARAVGRVDADGRAGRRDRAGRASGRSSPASAFTRPGSSLA